MTHSRSITVEEFESEALPHLKHLYQTAAHVIGDRTEAEDLVQQTYLQAWKAFDRFQPGTNCRAWLFRILFNVIRHHRRGWFSRRVLVDCDFFEDVLPGENPVPDTLTDEDILFALDRVPQSFREVLLLVDVQEFSYKEAAETLGIPIGTVMSRVSRGRDLLRNQLVKNNSSVVVQSTTVEATREAQRDSASPALLQS